MDPTTTTTAANSSSLPGVVGSQVERDDADSGTPSSIDIAEPISPEHAVLCFDHSDFNDDYDDDEEESMCPPGVTTSEEDEPEDDEPGQIAQTTQSGNVLAGVFASSGEDSDAYRFQIAHDNDEKQCWVCFASEEDDPTADWVHPCR